MNGMSQHRDYPHEPGTLFDCPACEDYCNCSGNVNDTMCLFCSNQWDDLLANAVR